MVLDGGFLEAGLEDDERRRLVRTARPGKHPDTPDRWSVVVAISPLTRRQQVWSPVYERVPCDVAARCWMMTRLAFGTGTHSRAQVRAVRCCHSVP